MDTDELRALFPVTEHLVYLNHAGVAPISQPVAHAMGEAIAECLHWGAHRYTRLLAAIQRTRASAAELLSAAPDEVAFVKNTSEGISFVSEGFPWRPGDAVVFPEGEFPSNIFPWLHLQRRGVRTVRVPLTGNRLRLDDFRTALDQPGVRLLAVSSVEFETGFRNDLAALGQLCRERGVFFFVDAIQSLGCLPLAPASLGIHALAADGHKWLLGPEGIGLFWVNREAWDVLEPREVGWKSVVDALDYSQPRFVLRRDAEKFEAGSHSVVALHGLGAALRLLLDVGAAQVAARVTSLVLQFDEGLRQRGYPVLSSPEPEERAGIVSFLPASGPAALVQRLGALGVAAAARGRGIRLSPHFYNDASDVSRFFGALEEAERTSR